MELAVEPAALFDLGNGLLRRGQTEAAIDAFERCRLAAPDHAATCYNLANALLHAGRPVDAVDAYVACLRLDPTFGAAYVNLAGALRKLALLDHAQSMAELAIRRSPDEPQALLSLAGVLHDKAEYAAAARLYQQVIDLVPDHAGAMSSLGNTLRAMGQTAIALAMHDRAVAAAPDNPDIRFNRATMLLAAGHLEQGWAEHEWRWRRPPQRPRGGFGPPWQGEDIAGRTILLHAEQGHGDTVQFVRYAPMVAARGARVVAEVQPSLVRLVRTMPGIGYVASQGDKLPRFDTHCPLMSLPRVFGTVVETIPAELPYLRANAAESAAWEGKLRAGSGLRVGIAWAGAAHRGDAEWHLIDRRRSLALADLAPLLETGSVHWVSLQKDRPWLWDATSARTVAAQAMPRALFDPMGEITDFADTAALISRLDLVISVDTAVAHLAGALGRPVWLLSRYDGCWRWMVGRDDSPWYPGMRIYRQERPGDWSAVIMRVCRDLAATVEQGDRRP